MAEQKPTRRGCPYGHDDCEHLKGETNLAGALAAAYDPDVQRELAREIQRQRLTKEEPPADVE